MRDHDFLAALLAQGERDREALHRWRCRVLITTEQYFGHKAGLPDATPDRKSNADRLLKKVNALLANAQSCGVRLQIDPDTGTNISGSKGGSGDGGFRLSTATTGRPGSMHKEGRGIDIFDPDNTLDNWITNPILEEHGLYRESADATPGWCHVQDKPPRSGARTYNP